MKRLLLAWLAGLYPAIFFASNNWFAFPAGLSTVLQWSASYASVSARRHRDAR